ncbi:MAG: EVE domain-containing protein [Gammaproteobacteria bacterium]
MRYWLMKSEPETFGIEHLKKSPGRATMWDGVRNYQVRNMLRDEFRKGDRAFFYHSSCATPGIVGVIEILCAGYPDPTAFMRGHRHYDPKSLRDSPRWYTVDVKFKRDLPLISLDELRLQPTLAGMPLLKRGNRLSITPLSPEEWTTILALR